MLKRIRSSARNEELRLIWERRTEPLMLILAAAMIPLLVGHFDESLPESLSIWLFVGDTVIWAMFAFDLAARVWMAEHRRSFLIQHWYEVLIVVIPFLRPIAPAPNWRLLLVRVVLRRRAIGGSF